jgi:hypothetical protein
MQPAKTSGHKKTGLPPNRLAGLYNPYPILKRMAIIAKCRQDCTGYPDFFQGYKNARI